METLISLYELRTHLGFAPQDTRDDVRLIQCMVSVTALLQRFTQRQFFPRVEQRTLTHEQGGREIILPSDLLTLESVHLHEVNLPLDQITLIPMNAPYGILRFSPDVALARDDSLKVRGVWGWHDAPDQMWRPTEDAIFLHPFLNATSTIIPLTDVDAPLSGTLAPRFQVGQLLRIDDEMMIVLAINSGTNTIHVQRGVLGSALASHANGSMPLYFQPPHDLQYALLVWAGMWYRHPDTLALPPEIQMLIAGLRREQVAV